MTKFPNPTPQIWLDFEALPTEAVDLSSEMIDQAVELSAQIPNEQRQWQTYLNVLALCSFEEWLGTRATNLTTNREHCSLNEPATANAIEAVCNLKVNEFKLCLIATGSLTDEEVTLPRAVVDLPEFVPHFYVLVEVQEEQDTALVYGFLSYDQLVNQRRRVNLEAEEDWTYQLPLNWFEGSPNHLLLNLRCLEPTVIPLPMSLPNRQLELSRMRSALEALLPQLQSPDRQLWQVLTWEQGAAVLTSPELLNWLYQLQSQTVEPQSIVSLQNHLADILQLLTQPALNAGRWLSNQLDELAQELSWALLPNFAMRGEMRSEGIPLGLSLGEEFPAIGEMRSLRSPEEEFPAIVRQLVQTGVEIPLQARGAYRNLNLAGTPLRVYAVTWPMRSESIDEWTLLLVLGGSPGISLPPGLQLRVSDQSSVLVEQVWDAGQGDSYLFTSVIGAWDEKFIVTVSLTPSIKQTLPPFSFNPQQESL